MYTDGYVHVSYILGTFNRAQFLDRVLENARKFIKHDDELIIIDGGSADDTFEIISKYKDIVTVFVSEKDCGPVHAYNKALLKARGRLIINLSDDDYFYPDGVIAAIQVMDNNPDIDALVCGGEKNICNSETKDIDLVGYQFLPEPITLTSNIKNIMNYTTAGFLVLRDRVIAVVGIFDTLVQAADTEYMSRLFLSGVNFKYLNVKMFKHTEYLHSSQRNTQESNIDRIRILIRHGQWSELLLYRWHEVRTALGFAYYTNNSAFKIAAESLLKICFVCIKSLLQLKGSFCMRFGRKAGDVDIGTTEPVWDLTLR